MTMLELFIELNNQIFWEGYAQQLANENPAVFNSEFNDFINNYNWQDGGQTAFDLCVEFAKHGNTLN